MVCTYAIAARAHHDSWQFVIGALGGGALMIVGAVAAARRSKRQALDADGCRSGIVDPDRADALATARLRRPSDRVVSK
jgi:hypothetical protein